jgi:hypothetical protein
VKPRTKEIWLKILSIILLPLYLLALIVLAVMTDDMDEDRKKKWRG